MASRWMRPIRFPIRSEQFYQLPRHPAYKYEFLDGVAYVSPQPRYFHAVLDLKHDQRVGYALSEVEVEIGAIEDKDEAELIALFADAFSGVVPFVGLWDEKLISAGRSCLQQTREGGDGTWCRNASFVARWKGEVVGAVYITVLPPGMDLCRGDVWTLDDFAPVEADSGEGTPHLTWIFVSRSARSQGVATRLLQESIRSLRQVGYKELVTTIVSGNEKSLLWHWQNGFRICSIPGSLQRMRKELQRK
ncbi:MAG: GNAT family N-acetyltransferase [Gemmataceae bacterium]